MASTEETAEEAVTQEEITGSAPSDRTIAPKQNAFSMLMLARKHLSPNPHSTRLNPELVPPPPPTNFSGRNGLGAYLSKPESFPSAEVLYHTPSFVAISDLYPKSVVHTLLLPRDLTVSMKHPLLALQDPEFLTEIKEEVTKLKQLVASQLRRKFGAISASERVRRDAMDAAGADAADVELPPGRDWEKEVKVGIHAGPSMTHMHVHVLSRDMHSECMRHRKHYNSFNTPFFVEMEEFPLEEGGVERKLEGRAGWLAGDFICWRCGKSFGNKFKKLKEHLEDEFQEWTKE